MKYSILCFWDKFCYDTNFLTSYFKNHHYTKNYNEADILIVGSFVGRTEYSIIKKLKCRKILYISEPIQFFYPYTFELWKENIFCMVFGCINKDLKNSRIKLPLYMTYFDYKNKNNFINNAEPWKDCCLINNHDKFGSRTAIYSLLKDVMHIECPSKLFNNCSNEELNRIGNVEYIKQFKFNICSENTRTVVPGYITEKLLNCCLGGAIPIYYGYFDEIDEKIFNKNRILFYDKDTILEVRDKIVHLLKNPEEFNTFYNQSPFCDTAYDTLLSLENDFMSAVEQF